MKKWDYKRKVIKRTGLALTMMMLVCGQAHAATYTGGDWQGRDLAAGNDDSFSGIFTNIGAFVIPAGVKVGSDTDRVEFYSDSVDVSASYDARTISGSTLVFSANEINVGGSIFSESLKFNGNNKIYLRPGSVIDVSSAGGTITALRPGSLNIMNRSVTRGVSLFSGLYYEESGFTGSYGGDIFVGSENFRHSVISPVTYPQPPIPTPLLLPNDGLKFVLSEGDLLTLQPVSSVPLPATGLLFGSGLLGLAGSLFGRSKRIKK